MTEKINSFHGTRFLVSAAAIVIIIYGINQAQSVVTLFLVSVFLTLIGTPPVLWLERKRVPTFAAVMIVMAGMIALLVIIGGVLGVSLSTISEALPVYQKRLHGQLLTLRSFLAGDDESDCWLLHSNGLSAKYHADPAHGYIHSS